MGLRVAYGLVNADGASCPLPRAQRHFPFFGCIGKRHENFEQNAVGLLPVVSQQLIELELQAIEVWCILPARSQPGKKEEGSLRLAYVGTSGSCSPALACCLPTEASAASNADTSPGPVW